MKLSHSAPIQHRAARSALFPILLLHVWCFTGAAFGATFVVNGNGDGVDDNPGNGSCSTGNVIVVSVSPPILVFECTLRAALEEANALAGFDVIEFSGILPRVAGVVEITPTSALPIVTSHVLIDGYSHPSYNPGAANPTPIINVLGGSTSPTTSGFVFIPGSDNSTLRGLAIVDFPASGILISQFFVPGPQNIRIEGNFIGINRNSFYRGNDLDGITINNAANNRIGQSCNFITGCSGQRNVIASNGRSGVRILGNGNRVAGNYIGVDRFGSETFVPFGGSTPNAEHGVHILPNSTGNEIGSFGAIFDGIGFESVVSGNLISGNQLNGLEIEGEGNFVYGNFIGTNAAGTGALSNQGAGINVLFASDNQIGSVGIGGNLISGNAGNGISLADPGAGFENVIVEGNRIGVNAAGTAPLGNGGHGIRIDGDNHVIDSNLIGANANTGISDSGVGSLIINNFIGTNASGSDLGNQVAGILVVDGNNQIGGTGLGNTLGFNGVGILGSGSSFNVDIEGNFIGTNASGADLGNDAEGIRVLGAGWRIGATDGLANGLGNVVGFNETAGIVASTGSFDTRVMANFIGTDGLGRDLGNHGAGVSVASTTRVGSTLAASGADVARDGNVVAFNDESILVDASTTGIVVRGNQIRGNDSIGIDLAPDGPNANDSGDSDVGANLRQNHPQFDPSATAYVPATGNFAIRYLVDSSFAQATYPLTVDFYLYDPWLTPGDQAGSHLGADVYPILSARNFRSITLVPIAGSVSPNAFGFIFGGLRATATDANGNTSELSIQAVPVPESGFVGMTLAGWVALACAARFRRIRIVASTRS